MAQKSKAAQLQFDKLSVSFSTPNGQLSVLERIDFSVLPGEIVAVIGPSGCGKSTLIHTAAGFIRPSAGKVLMDKQIVSGHSRERGVVLQNLGLFPWKTVRGNVAFGLEMQDLPTAEKDQTINRLLDGVGLTSFAGFYPEKLSGGMAQRVALARTLAPNPKILLLDEPFGALDAQTRMEMHQLLLELHADRNITILIVTHDVDEALFLADRVLVLTARPAKVLREFSPGVPRPRSYTTLTDDLLVKAKEEILSCLREETLYAQVQRRTALISRHKADVLRIGYVPSMEAFILHEVRRRLRDKTTDVILELYEHESGPALLRGVENGDLDLSHVGSCPALAALQSHRKIRLLRDGGYTIRGQRGNGLVVSPKFTHLELDKLATEPIAVNGLTTNSDFLVRSMLSPYTDRPRFKVMPSVQILGELSSGRVGIAALFWPYLWQALEIPDIELKYDFSELLDPLQLSVLVVNSEKQARNYAGTSIFLDVWDATVRDYNSGGRKAEIIGILNMPKVKDIEENQLPRFSIQVSVDRMTKLNSMLQKIRGEWKELELSRLIVSD